jgi:hypothetical protein
MQDLLLIGAFPRLAQDLIDSEFRCHSLAEPAIDSHFFALDNVVLSPHMGSATHETRIAMAPSTTCTGSSRTAPRSRQSDFHFTRE